MKTLMMIMCLLFGLDAISAEKQMYRWRDANNQLHVGQIPPTDYPYETITMSVKSQPKQAAENPADNPEASPSSMSSAERASTCERVKANQKILAEDKPVYLKNAEGVSVLLSPNEVNEQQQLAAKQIELFCQK
jgi:hypothetical protein